MLVLGALLILGAPTWRPQYELKSIYADEDLATTTSQVDHAAVKAKSDGFVHDQGRRGRGGDDQGRLRDLRNQINQARDERNRARDERNRARSERDSFRDRFNNAQNQIQETRRSLCVPPAALQLVPLYRLRNGLPLLVHGHGGLASSRARDEPAHDAMPPARPLDAIPPPAPHNQPGALWLCPWHIISH